MFSAALRWLGRVPAQDPFERRTAMATQAFCIGLSLLIAGNLVARWHEVISATGFARVGVAADVLSIGAAVAAVVLIRRGRFHDAYALVIFAFLAILDASLVARGLEYHRLFLLRVFAVLLVLPALLIGRWALWSAVGALLAGMLAGHLRDVGMLGGHGPMHAPEPPFGGWIQAVIVMLLLAVMLDRFGAALAEAYGAALARQREAERTSRELEAAKQALELEMERRMAAESMLFQSQKLEAIGRLSGGVAHDFNNLLTAILGFTQLSRDVTSEDDPRRAWLDDVLRAAQRGAGLTRQLLSFARRQVVTPRPVRLDDALRAVEPMLRRLIGESVRIELATPSCPPVMIDPVQLEQVLVNLAVNARDAMPRGGLLRFETDTCDVRPGSPAADAGLRPGEHVRLCVIDTGQGMDAATLASAFEPFFTTKEVGKGTGLGLATCYGIVRQAEGTIHVTSVPGEGTRFEILLPVTHADVVPDAASVRRPSPSVTGTILVVEDDAQLLDLVSRILSTAGHTVLAAADPDSALARVRAHAGVLDLVLSDIVLPGIDGIQLAQRLSALRPGVRTLFMSGHSHDVIARHGVSEGRVDIVQKPFTPLELLARVEGALAGRRASA